MIHGKKLQEWSRIASRRNVQQQRTSRSIHNAMRHGDEKILTQVLIQEFNQWWEDTMEDTPQPSLEQLKDPEVKKAYTALIEDFLRWIKSLPDHSPHILIYKKILKKTLFPKNSIFSFLRKK